MSPLTLILIGRSGCGKGTQAELLQKKIKEKDPTGEIFYLETGMNFRQFICGESYSNKLASEIMKKGDRQPDFLAIWMWSHIILDKFKGTEHLLLDGITRSLPEAMAFTTALEFYGRSAKVVFIDVSRKWAIERMVERGRSDDTSKEEMRKKLDWFDMDSMPAINYFDENDRYELLKINGEQSIDAVHAEVMAKLKL